MIAPVICHSPPRQSHDAALTRPADLQDRNPDSVCACCRSAVAGSHRTCPPRLPRFPGRPSASATPGPGKDALREMLFSVVNIVFILYSRKRTERLCNLPKSNIWRGQGQDSNLSPMGHCAKGNGPTAPSSFNIRLGSRLPKPSQQPAHPDPDPPPEQAAALGPSHSVSPAGAQTHHGGGGRLRSRRKRQRPLSDTGSRIPTLPKKLENSHPSSNQ